MEIGVEFRMNSIKKEFFPILLLLVLLSHSTIHPFCVYNDFSVETGTFVICEYRDIKRTVSNNPCR